jgi:hypothetical protein
MPVAEKEWSPVAGTYVNKNFNLLKQDPGVLKDVNSSYIGKPKKFADLENKDIEIDYAVGRDKNRMKVNKFGTGMTVRTHKLIEGRKPVTYMNRYK